MFFDNKKHFEYILSMKAIIPVAGVGTKLRPHTYTQPKALIPVAGKTILSFIVDQLHQAGINEFIFIIGYLGEKIKEYVKQTYPLLTCHFVEQNERFGTGHAIELTQSLAGNDEIFVALGDTICEYDIREVLDSPYSMIGVKRVDDPRDFGVAEIDDENFVRHVYEKPVIPKSNLALVGLYKIKETNYLFECLKHLYEKHNENYSAYNFTDAIECMIQRGAKVKSFKVKNWFDCGKKETLIESNATLLKKYGGYISKDIQIENSIILPPVSIGTGCIIKNSVIGPHASIDANAEIHFSIVKESIIGSYTYLSEVLLDNSLIGSDASVKGLSRSLNIGDNTEIDFG